MDGSGQRQDGRLGPARGAPRIREAFNRTTRPTGLALLGLVTLAVVVASCQTWSTGPRGSESAAPPPDLGAAPPREPEMRVRVKSGLSTLKISGPSGFTLEAAGLLAKPVPGPLSVGIENGRLVVVDGGGGGGKGERHVFKALAPVTIAAQEGGGGATRLQVERMTLPGKVRLIPRADAARRADAKFDVIELVPLEEYLPGVVAAEMLREWTEPAAFETQSIAARTFALHQRQLALRDRKDYDLEADTRDQAYSGYTSSQPAQDGVRNTRGVVLTCQGKVLRTYYSSTCGGRTASAADTWPTIAGYEYNLEAPIQAAERPHACDGSKWYRWEVKRDGEELSRRIRQWGKENEHPVAGIDRLVSVSVERRTSTDRPAAYRLRDNQGSPYILKGEQLRLACNQTVQGLPALEIGKTRVLSSDLELEFGGSEVAIRGRGFGHGVGLCQYCTNAMAKRGDTPQKMLERFYPGAKLERAY